MELLPTSNVMFINIQSFDDNNKEFVLLKNIRVVLSKNIQYFDKTV